MTNRCCGVITALAAIFQHCPTDRPADDARIAEHTISLHCKRLVEPGCIDPDFLHAAACTVSRCPKLRSIYVSGWSHLSLAHLTKHSFKDITGFSPLRKVSFVKEPEVRMISTDWPKDPSLWTKLRGLDKGEKNRASSSKQIPTKRGRYR